MKKTLRLPQLLSVLLLLGGLAAIWMLFGPLKLGGPVSYVMVNGISMEPNYHTGDLVLLRRAASYQPGEIVTYHDPMMNADIIHRILSVEADRFVMKGDNNSWIDPYRPGQAEVLGKLWIYIPKASSTVLWIRQPIPMAAAAGLLGGVLMFDLTNSPSRKKGKKKVSPRAAGVFESGLYMFGFLSAAFIALGFLAFTHPLTKASPKIQYTQTGVFSYSARGSSTVYDSGAVRSGEPIFTNLACTLNLGFHYGFSGRDLSGLSGHQYFDAVVMDSQTGWKRTIPLTSPAAFSGAAFNSHASMDLCGLESLVTSVEKATGIRSGSYELTITNHIDIAGNLPGQKFSQTFEPALVFRFDSLRFYLSSDSGVDPLRTVKNGSIDNPARLANSLNLFSLQLPISDLRRLSLYGLAPSLLGLLLFGLALSLTSRRSQGAAIRLKYGSLLLDANESGLQVPALSQVIDVASIENLARLAERQNTLITHVTHATEDVYMVQSGGAVYRYDTGKPSTGPQPAGAVESVGNHPLQEPPAEPSNSPAPAAPAQGELPVTDPEPVEINRNFVYIHRQTETFRVEPLEGKAHPEDPISSFHISDALWAALQPLLPKPAEAPQLGCHWLDVPDRTCADAIFYVLKSGCSWETLDRLDICPAATAYERFRRWTGAGVFTRLWRAGGAQFEELKDAKSFPAYAA